MANFSAGSLRLNWEKEIEVERAPRRKWAGMSSRRSSFTVGTDWFGCGYREQQGVVLYPFLWEGNLRLCLELEPISEDSQQNTNGSVAL